MRMRQAVLAAAAVASVLAGLSVAASASSASAAAGNGCPANKVGVLTDSNVTASVSNADNVSTYQFSSIKSENPSGGVPGLMSYCVYPSPLSQPKVAATATGANGVKWVSSAGSNNFAFVRPGGDPSDIPLDGKTVMIGNATWKSISAVPVSQSFVLHVNDSGTCASLYGAGTSATCYVTPVPPPAPACSKGDSTVAYNSMPSDVVNCVNPAIGFEAQSASEFGNAVNLNPMAGSNLSQLKVDFQSFACESGHWDSNPSPCFTSGSPGADTFQWPVTANIYATDSSGQPGALLATSGPVTQTIPYRPSADTTGHCTGPIGAVDGSNKWWNPSALGGAGACQSSIGTVLTFSGFTAPGGGPVALPSQVIWTVSFSTSDFGTAAQPPQGVQACSSGLDPRFPTLGNGGCPYDSLNVGDNGNTGGADFPTSHITGAPYAGSDIVPGAAELSSTSGAAYCDGGTAGTGSLRLDSPTSSPLCGWDGLRPLGEIITN